MQELIERLRGFAGAWSGPQRDNVIYEINSHIHGTHILFASDLREAAEALTTAQAEIEALKAELAAALAKVEKLREALQDIAWPARLPSDGDPTVLRNHALATLAETQP